MELNAQLVKGDTEVQLWNQSYKGDLRSVVVEVVRAIAGEMRLTVKSRVVCKSV